MARTSGRIPPADLDGAGARSEDAELRGAAGDERAEITRRLEHIERIGGQDIAKLEQVRRLEDHPHRCGGRIGVCSMETEDMLIGPATGDDQVAMIRGGAKNVVGVVWRLHPATAVAEEFKFELFSRAEDVLDGDAQFETFGTGDADRIQDPALHIDGFAPIVEEAGHADRTLGDLRAEGLPEKEMHAAGFQPMPRTQSPGTHIGRLE